MQVITWMLLTACTGDGENPNASLDDIDQDGFAAAEDCDDTDATVNPGALEVCDGRDNDCDGRIDDTDENLDLTTAETFFFDGDGDGFGGQVTTVACVLPPDHVTNTDDCDDLRNDVYPDAPELCDSIDNDCDEQIDDDDPNVAEVTDTFFLDGDGDGQGSPGTGVAACEAPGEDWVTNDTDCDDEVASTYVGAPELCDDVDNDCDGTADEDVQNYTWYPDGDGDGFGDPDGPVIEDCNQPANHVLTGDDCNDDVFVINPAGAESVADGVDGDCDGQEICYLDDDQDGFRSAMDTIVSSDLACDGPREATFDAPVDCDDTEETVNPDAEEICDTLDNDCDGDIDETAPVWYLDSDDDGFGDADETQQACEAPSNYVANADDCDDSEPTAYPGADEVCDTLDNDCDNEIDEEAPFWNRDDDEDGYGDPDQTTQACTIPAKHADNADDCDDSDADVNPDAREICDTIDNNCADGIDEDASWWDTSYPYRVLFTVETAGDAEQPPIALTVDFADALAGLGASGGLDTDSIRVVSQACDGGQPELPSQFIDDWSDLFSDGSPLDTTGDDRGVVTFLHDTDGDYETAEVLAGGDPVTYAVYFADDTGSATAPSYQTDLAITFDQMSNSVLQVTMDKDKGGLIDTLTLDGSSPSLLSLADSPSGNGVYIDNDDQDPQDGSANLVRLFDGPVLGAVRASGVRTADGGSYYFRTIYFAFAYRPQIYSMTELLALDDTTLSFPGDASLGIQPWSSVHDNLVSPIYTQDNTLGHYDQSDGSWGITVGWLTEPTFPLAAQSNADGITLVGNALLDVGGGSPQDVATDTVLLDSPIVVALPHAGSYDAAQFNAVVSPPTPTILATEAQ